MDEGTHQPSVRLAQSERVSRGRAAQAQAVLEDCVELIGDLTEERAGRGSRTSRAGWGVNYPNLTKAVVRPKR